MKTNTKSTKKPETKQVTEAEHFRRRLPSEKPTREDADNRLNVLTWEHDGNMCRHPWMEPFGAEVIAWIPGHLPSHLIPKAPTPEELNRQAFEKWAESRAYSLMRQTHPNQDKYSTEATRDVWHCWQAATTHRSA